MGAGAAIEAHDNYYLFNHSWFRAYRLMRSSKTCQLAASCWTWAVEMARYLRPFNSTSRLTLSAGKYLGANERVTIIGSDRSTELAAIAGSKGYEAMAADGMTVGLCNLYLEAENCFLHRTRSCHTDLVARMLC